MLLESPDSHPGRVTHMREAVGEVVHAAYSQGATPHVEPRRSGTTPDPQGPDRERGSDMARTIRTHRHSARAEQPYRKRVPLLAGVRVRTLSGSRASGR